MMSVKLSNAQKVTKSYFYPLPLHKYHFILHILLAGGFTRAKGKIKMTKV
jgi:hypothetical protein